MSDPLAKPLSAPRTLKPPSKDDEIIERRSLRDYYIILRERLWIALPVALLVALGLFYVQSREVPQYSSHASIKFKKSEKIVANIQVVNPEVENEATLNTYIRELKSEHLVNMVEHALTLEQQNILLEPYKKALPPGAPLPPVSAALGSLSVQSSRNSFIIDLTVVHRSPQAAKLLADLYVSQFIDSIRISVRGSNEDAYKLLNDTKDELQKKAEESNRALQDFMREKKLVSLDSTTDFAKTSLQNSNDLLQRASQHRREAEDLLTFIERYQQEKRDPMEIGYISGYGPIPALRTKRDELVREHLALTEIYYEEYPAMKKVSNDIGIVEDQIARAITLAIADLKTDIDKARAAEQAAQSQYAINEKAFLDLRDVAVKFKQLSDDHESDRANYLQILTRFHETETNRKFTDVPVSQLDGARVNLTPFAPDPVRITKTATGVFFLVFFAIAIGLSFVDDRIKSSWDVETFIGATLLGIIPDLADMKDDEKYRLVFADGQGAGVEPFLGLYSSVKIHSKLDFPKALLVTSTVPGEGKTLVSCNLAGSFARHGRTTLLIDCDLRRPMLHRHFNKPNETGLISWYENGALLDDTLLTNPFLGITPIGENLSLISSGGRSKSPTQFLESVAFAQLIERLKRHFDLIVIDSPPMGAVTDGLLIAERADEVLYVCRFNRAFRKHIRLYIKALRSGKNEILGVVLNGLSPRRIEYYSNYRYYRSYKKYYGSQS